MRTRLALLILAALASSGPSRGIGAVQAPAPASAQAGATSKPALADRARQVLAQIDGTIMLTGISEPVEVLRDRWGTPHIYAKSTADLFFAQGFVAAQDLSLIHI